MTDHTPAARIEPLDHGQLHARLTGATAGTLIPDDVRAAIHAGHVAQVVIFCDGCGVEESGDYTGETREDRFEAARRWLAGRGWAITPGLDLCGDCGGETEVAR